MTSLSSFLYLLALFSTVKTNNADFQPLVLSPQPPVDCTTLILTMSDCLNFVKIGSDIQKPPVPCCNALKNVLKTDAGCLCEAFKLASANGLVLNVTKALTLPSACGVKSPPLGDCGFSIAPPTASPVNPPKPSPPSPPAPPRTPPVTPPAPPSPESEEPQVPTPAPAPAPAPEKTHKSGVSAHSVYFPALLGSLFVVSLAYF